MVIKNVKTSAKILEFLILRLVTETSGNGNHAKKINAINFEKLKLRTIIFKF